jgi:hypothetical protein
MARDDTSVHLPVVGRDTPVMGRDSGENVS